MPTAQEPENQTPAETKIRSIGWIVLFCVALPVLIPWVAGEWILRKLRKRFRLWRTRNDGKPKALTQAEIRFFRAIRRADDEGVEEYLASGVDAETVLETGVSALHVAVELNLLHIAELLLEAGANVNNPHPVSGETPIIRAARRNDAEMASLLIRHKAALGLHGYSGQTPLMCAVNQGNIKIARVLIEGGADPNQYSPDGRTARDLALKYNRNEVSKLFQGDSSQTGSVQDV